MSATSEANSLGSSFAVGVQGAKGTAATTLHELIATDSSLAPEFEYRDTRLEHPSTGGTTSWAMANTDQVTGYIGRASVTFPLRPKGIVPVLQATGFGVATVNNSTHYTHTLTQGTDAAHKWVTAMWKVDDSDAAYYVRGVDGRCTSLTISVSTEEIMCTAEFGFLTVAAYSTSQPTYVAEQSDEIVPWVGARTSAPTPSLRSCGRLSSHSPTHCAKMTRRYGARAVSICSGKASASRRALTRST